MFRAKLKTRTRQRNETLPELAQALRRLSRQAYPEASADLKETLARDYFIDALGDADTRWKIKQSRPKTLNDALEIAVELEAFQLADRQKGLQARTAHVAKIGSPTQTDTTKSSLEKEVKELQELVKRLQRGGQPQAQRARQFTKGCWACGETDHFRRDCPTAAQLDGGGTEFNRRRPERWQGGRTKPQFNNEKTETQAAGNEKLSGQRA